jgi:hypothetical protein
MLGLGVSSASQLGGTAFALENSILAAFKTRVLADSGVVEDYACLNLDVKDLITEPAPFTTGLLEFYPNAAAAYSLRQLRRSVSPYAIRVRRSGDSLEQDIGFNSNGELDTNALLDFANGGDAWVTVWYDQSSNGNDATQGTNADQPQIVSSGSVITQNGKPTLNFDGTDTFNIGSSDVYGQARLDAYCYMHSTDNVHIMFSQATSGSNYSYAVHDGSTSTTLASAYADASSKIYVNGSDINVIEGTTTRDDLHTAIITNGAANLNGAIIVHEDVQTTSWTDFKISAYANVWTYTGKMSEILLYNSDQSAKRTAIESNINDFYSIYS